MTLGGCASGSNNGSDDSEPSTGLPAPVMLAPSELEASPVEITLNRPLVVQVGEEDPGAWTGSVADESIAEFEPGGERDTATYNPAFMGIKPGETDATLVAPGGEVYDFTLVVTE